MSGYVYPFPSSHTTTGRIDQGQDFGGSGLIRSIGRARIEKTRSPWPEYENGAGILYRLLDGPYSGRLVYVYEGVRASVHPGQIVNAGQVIGSIIPGTSSGIETGWASPDGQPISRAEYTEDGIETKGGKGFAAFLAKLKKHGSSGEGGFSSFGPLGTAEEAITAPSRAIAGVLEEAPKAASGLAGEVASGLVGSLAKSAEPLMLNVGLLAGGAFLIYYGVALMAGVDEPALKLMRRSPAAAVVT